MAERMQKELFSVQEAAEFLGTTRQSLKKWADGIQHRRMGRRYFFTREALVDWAKGRDSVREGHPPEYGRREESQ